MVVRLLPWQPDYGPSMSNDIESDPKPIEPIDIRIEHDVWAPITPAPLPYLPVQIIDGVRRTEAHTLEDMDDGTTLFGLFGSYAVGAVHCDIGPTRSSHMIKESIRIERRYLHASDSTPNHVITSSVATLTFKSRQVPNATNANALIGALSQAMLDEEAKLATELSRNESVLTLLDGPLRSVRTPGRRIVGYVKRIQQWYIGAAERELLPTLHPGERTPLFMIPPRTGLESGQFKGRYSWFVRLRHLNRIYHPLSGLMRLEASGTLSLEEATMLADATAQLLPHLSSAPGKDPRAPHNLVPVGALETMLTHRLGDRSWVQRLLTKHLDREAVSA